MPMKTIRKWSRILHRDIGFFFVGASIIYGLSGIALNHLKDWNPNYHVKLKSVETNIDLHKSPEVKTNVLNFLEEQGLRNDYKSYYYPEPGYMKIFLSGGSSIFMDVETGTGTAEFLRRRTVCGETVDAQEASLDGNRPLAPGASGVMVPDRNVPGDGQ